MSDKSTNFKIKKYDTIGSEGAEEDDKYLFDCFVNTGDLDVLRDVDAPQRIIIGRTGSGKTALLRKLNEHEQFTTYLEPEDCALNFISNNKILQYLEAEGINLDPFYKLLWKHILIIEIIKMRYNITNEDQKQNVFEKLIEKYTSDKSKKDSIHYLNEWGEKFWETTEYRVKEITKKFEEKLGSKFSLQIQKLLQLSANGDQTKFNEEKIEVRCKAEDVIDHIQIQKLNKLVRTLADDSFSEGKQKFNSYFIIIDKLDEDWVNDHLRYKLIRALIETQKEFKCFERVKIITAIRQDLLERVFRETRKSGLQEEKYQSMYLSLKWTQSELINVLEKRINKLVKSRYTKKNLELKDLIIERFGKNNKFKTSDYIFNRTLRRPRDIINYFNHILKVSTELRKITATQIKQAEEGYSQSRFKAVCDEWAVDYPLLRSSANQLLYRIEDGCEINKLQNDDKINSLLTTLFEQCETMNSCVISKAIRGYLSSSIDSEQLILELVMIFYKVGFIGIKTNASIKTAFSYCDDYLLQDNEVSLTSKLYISPTFYKQFATILHL